MTTSLREAVAGLLASLPVMLFAQAPVPAPPQIQIRGAINAVIGKSVRIAGDQRKIIVTQGDETIVIEDQKDKNIVLRRTRLINGEKKTDEFKAPDFDSLKKNHPEAAELYRKHTEGALDGANPPAQLQLPLPPRLNGGDPFGVPRNSLVRRGQGTRRIQSTTKGRTIAIDDQYGEKIVMRITEKKEGEPKTRTVEAADLAELEAKDASAAGHYKRLTAEN